MDKSYRNILIIRTSAIGDVIMASPLIAALKQKFPDAKLSWLVTPLAANLLSENAQLDEVIVLPQNEFKELWKEQRYWQFFKQIKAFAGSLKARKFDLVLDTQGLLKSGSWAWFSGAKRRIGLGSREGSQYLMSEVLAKDKSDPEISSEYKALANYLGCDIADFSMNIPFSQQTEHDALSLLPEQLANQSYAVFCPFTTRPQKHWFDEHWLRLAGLLNKELALPVLIIGGPDDATKTEKLVASSDSIYRPMSQPTLLQSNALINNAKLLVGVDTGMTHAGIAQQTPTIALFGSTRPYLHTNFQDSVVIYLDKSCAPCARKPTCGGQFHCMNDITPDMVLQSVRKVLV